MPRPAFVLRYCPGYGRVALLWVITLAGGRIGAEEMWRAGAASVAITPEKNLWMAGFAARTRPAEGKETDLFAKALVLEDARGRRFVVVTLDLIGVPRVLRQAVERRVREAHGLAAESLLLNASHTHSGPEFRSRWVSAKPEELALRPEAEEYVRSLEDKLVAVVGEALKQLAPAQLGYSHARAGFAMNRRLPTPRGFQNSANPDGPVDHDVPVLRVTSPDGKQLRAVLFGYACHATTLALYQWNADYAGYAQTGVEAAHPGAVALFLNGASGDQNPYPRGTVELARQHGRALANGVETALGVAPRLVRGELRVALAEIALDYGPKPTREDFQVRAASKDAVEVAHAKFFLGKLDAGEALPASYPYPVQVVRLGDAVLLAALGGEVCVDYALRLKRELAGDGAVWLAGYSNDVMGYIPSRRVRREGGYEAEGAMRYSSVHPAPWDEALEERIVAKVHELSSQVRPGAR